MVCINSYHEDTGLLPIHKALGDGIWREDLISEITFGKNNLETRRNKMIQKVYRYLSQALHSGYA